MPASELPPVCHQDQDKDNEEDVAVESKKLFGGKRTDFIAAVSGCLLAVLMLALSVIVMINNRGDIVYWEDAKWGQLDIYNLGTVHDVPSPATRKDKDDLVESFAGKVE